MSTTEEKERSLINYLRGVEGGGRTLFNHMWMCVHISEITP